MNWDMLGHAWAVNLLKEHILQKRLRHAYLFTGPPGIGKRTLGLRLAQALNCQVPPAPGEPCRNCRTCQGIERMQYTDLAVVQAEQRGGVLKVDAMRDLQRSLSLAPYEGKYRLALMLRFEEANPSAANALLKTLEEPPPQVILILTAGSAESLLPTIVSRCEVLRLRSLPFSQVSQGLHELSGLPAAESDLLAHLAEGRPGYALQLHRQPALLEQRKAWLEELQDIIGSSRAERFAYAESLAKDIIKDRANLVRAFDLLQTWLSLWRDVLLQAAGSSAPLANLDFQEWSGILSENVGLQGARRAIISIERTREMLSHNVNARLSLEVLMLDLPHPPVRAA